MLAAAVTASNMCTCAQVTVGGPGQVSSLMPIRNGTRRFPSWLQISVTLCGSREWSTHPVCTLAS